MSTRQYFELMAQYNQWMNRALYEVCDSIPDVQRKKDVGAFFRSIHGTLNHILWGDRLWFGRFTQNLPALPRVGVDLHEDFAVLRSERESTDAFIMEWVTGLTDDWLQAPFSATSSMDGKTRRAPAWIMVSQVFNHQTHHRGQVTTLVKQLGFDTPDTDIPLMPGRVELL